MPAKPKAKDLHPIKLNTSIAGVGERDDILEGDFPQRQMLLDQRFADEIDPDDVAASLADNGGAQLDGPVDPA